MKIGVTGADGFLGSRILRFYEEKYEMKGYRHSDMDFTDEEAVRTVLSKDCPDLLIHTAAISDVGACERDPEYSEKVNVDGVRIVAKICREINARLIFCSSDQVYVGNGETMPHREGERLSPPTVYGRQKIRAEELAFQEQPDTAALRLSWMFASDFREGKEHGNLISTVSQAVAAGEQIRYPVHDYRSITDVWEVVRNLEYLFRVPAGIYNFGSENDRSTYELVKEFLESAGIGTGILEKNEEAFREQPRNLRMNTEKAAKLGVHFLSSVEALKKAGTCWKHNPA
nr:sugar nucleotide-binding protein [uncultured Sellimonas sp.]